MCPAYGEKWRTDKLEATRAPALAASSELPWRSTNSGPLNTPALPGDSIQTYTLPKPSHRYIRTNVSEDVMAYTANWPVRIDGDQWWEFVVSYGHAFMSAPEPANSLIYADTCIVSCSGVCEPAAAEL